MTYRELLEKAANKFRLIADETNLITSGNLSNHLTCIRGFAVREAESIERHLQEQVKDVDLEKEIDDFIAKGWEGIEGDKHFYDMIKNDVSDIAKHFFELGLKAQKGK